MLVATHPMSPVNASRRRDMLTATTASVRPLPFRVRPLPDEPFDSWLEAMAHAYKATLGEMSIALGLVTDDGSQTTRWGVARWAVELTSAQARGLELATGIPSEEFHQMTRVRFWQSGIRTGPTGTPSRTSPATGNGGRYCPDCLRDSGGRWRMSWQLSTGFACLRHRRLLVDLCTRCGVPPRGAGHPLNGIPSPGTCHNRAPGSTSHRTRCRGDLTLGGPRIVATGTVLAAQRMVFRVLSSGRAAFGIYAALPQPSLAMLKDLLFVSRLCRVAAREQGIIGLSGLDEVLVAEFLSLSSHKDVLRGRPQLAVNIAVGVTLAVHTLNDRQRTIELLRDRIPDSVSYTEHTPQLQELIAVALGRRRRPTTLLQSAMTPTGDPESRASKLPTMLWDVWARRLAPRRTHREIAATALSAAVVFAGSRLTHDAALHVLDPTAPSRIVTNVMRALGSASSENSTLIALVRLARYLDETEVPIDYDRRRTVDFGCLLSNQTWVHICDMANVHSGGPRRYATARYHLFQRLIGSPVGSAPEPWQRGRPIRHRDVAEFRRGAPQAVLDELDTVGEQFLTGLGIREPLTWAPPFDLVSDLQLPAASAPLGYVSKWPTARPARDLAARTAPRLPAEYLAGATTRELAQRAGVSRQTVSRSLADAAVQTRRGRPGTFDIDVDWLYDRYQRDKLTIVEIAALVGCSPTTITSHLRRADISLRARGVEAEHGPSAHPLAGDSLLLRKTLIGRNALGRARRFLIVAEYPSFSAAASDLGVTHRALSKQFKRLGLAAGGPLFVRAAGVRPARLTPLGERLAKELRRVLPPAENPTDRGEQ